MKYLTLLVGCFIFLVALSLQVVAQEPAAGNVPDAGVAPPIKLTAVTINTGSNRRGKTNGSWLTEPLVQVENTSGKTIQFDSVKFSLEPLIANDFQS